jgi:hypothetical protein
MKPGHFGTNPKSVSWRDYMMLSFMMFWQAARMSKGQDGYIRC